MLFIGHCFFIPFSAYDLIWYKIPYISHKWSYKNPYGQAIVFIYNFRPPMRFYMF